MNKDSNISFYGSTAYGGRFAVSAAVSSCRWLTG